MTELLRSDGAINKAIKFIDEGDNPILDALRPSAADNLDPNDLDVRMSAYLGLLLDDADRFSESPEMMQIKDDVAVLVRQLNGDSLKYKTKVRRNLRVGNVMRGLALRAGELTNELLLSDEYRLYEGIAVTDFVRELIQKKRINENVGVGVLLALSSEERSVLRQNDLNLANELIRSARQRLVASSQRLMRSTESFTFDAKDPSSTMVKDMALREGNRYLSMMVTSPYHSIEDLSAQPSLIDSLRRPVDDVGKHVNARVSYLLDKLFPEAKS